MPGSYPPGRSRFSQIPRSCLIRLRRTESGHPARPLISASLRALRALCVHSPLPSSPVPRLRKEEAGSTPTKPECQSVRNDAPSIALPIEAEHIAARVSHPIGSQNLPRPVLSRIVPIPGRTATARSTASTGARVHTGYKQREHNKDRAVVHDIDCDIFPSLSSPFLHPCPQYQDLDSIV